uniref:Olfactory receptor n=1 Tax=Leptobrachium leishanense TaxID=445787 RepID=A0A8C5M8T7_9ANUR
LNGFFTFFKNTFSEIYNMKIRNQTITTEFILLGFSRNLNINIFLFCVFSLIYLITVIANMFLIMAVVANAHLHVPMYFLLCNLSLLDLCYSTNATPKLLVDLFAVRRTISFSACAIQLHVNLFLGSTEYFLLAAMAYDRYVAICHPLHYPLLMSMNTCYLMAAFVWILSFSIAIVPSLITPISVCFPNIVNHFMCEVLAVLKLACDDIHQSELLIFSISFFSLLLPLACILLSYAFIIYSVLQIQSVERRKTFSTCVSHMTVVALCFGSAMVLYFGPSSNYSTNQYISIIYGVVTPMLNPLIYSLRNNDVKAAGRKIYCAISGKRSHF